MHLRNTATNSPLARTRDRRRNIGNEGVKRERRLLNSSASSARAKRLSVYVNRRGHVRDAESNDESDKFDLTSR